MLKHYREIIASSVGLLRPDDAEQMTAWKVDKAVWNVKNDWPELIDPVPEQVADAAPETPGSLFDT
jgi:putative SOS response-associated peptidase YedK